MHTHSHTHAYTHTCTHTHTLQVSYTIYGVITEPGKHTTIMSLYGYTSQRGWVVITIEFQHIFTRNCDDNDYTLWVPWDEVN